MWTPSVRLFLFLAIPALLSAVDKPVGKSSVPATVDRQRLLALIPAPPPAKAVAQGPAVFYDSSKLYEYMDGAADVFQLYDVRTLIHQEFKLGETDLMVDIFDMSTLENAFGIYSSERSPGYNFVDIGTEGYRNEGIVNFFARSYYVKLAAFGDGAARLLEDFARGIEARIGKEKAFPPMIARFPSAGRKPHSEQYLRKDPLGHAFLSPAYQAQYVSGKSESTLMISVAKDASEAAARLKTLSDHFRSSGRLDPAPEFANGAVRGSNSYEGTLIACAKGRYLVLLLNPGAGAGGLLKDALARLN